MRSPGASRMIQTRVRSFSDSSSSRRKGSGSLPRARTRPRSRPATATCLSSRRPCPAWSEPWDSSATSLHHIYRQKSRAGQSEGVHGRGREQTRDRHRRLDERPAVRPAAAARAAGRSISTSGSTANCPAAAPASSRKRELIERLRALGLDTDDLGVQITTRKILDAHGARDACVRMPADADGLGAGLSPAARCVSGGALSPRRGLAGLRARCERRDGAFRRRRDASRPICWSAPTASARPCASNCCPSSCRSMPATSPGARCSPESAFPPRCIASCSNSCRSACRRASSSSAIRWPGPDNDLRPGHRRYNVVWYRPADEATELQWLLTDESGVHACDLDPAAADPARGDRRDARRRRAAAGAAVPRRSCG